MPELIPDWTLESQLSYAYNSFTNPTQSLMFPPGAFFGTFPQGVWGQPGLREEGARGSMTALYSGWDAHRLLTGAGLHWGDIFKTTSTRNFIQLPGPGPLLPRPGGNADVSDTPEVFLPENQRTSHYVFVQDEWMFSPGWELTTGIRYDKFDDIGSSINPRAAVVWQTTPALTSKLLYGEAFRPPAFFELYGMSNPVSLGNPDLRPEKLRNAELAFNWRPHTALVVDASLYQFRINDYIDFLPDPGSFTFTAHNANQVQGRGLELEVHHQINGSLQLTASYSHQETRDTTLDRPLGLAPSAEGFLRAVWEMAPRWQFTPQLNWIGERKRTAGDARAALDGYVTLDFSLRKQWSSDIELALIGRNLFNTDVREPSRGPNAGQLVPTLPDDLPQAGRSVTLEGSVRW